MSDHLEPRRRVESDPSIVARQLSRYERIFLLYRDDPLQVSAPFGKRFLPPVVFRDLIGKHLITWREIDSSYVEFLTQTFADPSVHAYWVGLTDFGREVRSKLIADWRSRIVEHVRELVDQEWTSISSAQSISYDIRQYMLGLGMPCQLIHAPAQSTYLIDAEEASIYVAVYYGDNRRATRITVRPCIGARRMVTIDVRKG